MWARWVGLSLVLPLLWGSTALFGESSGLDSTPPFMDSVTYPVPGLLLNQWREASLAQERSLKAALEQVLTSQRSFALYKQRRLIDCLVVAGCSIIVGGVAGHLLK